MNSVLTSDQTQDHARRLYRAVWRWHFYAGVFCIPFVIWLACTGSIYLFKPQIERWLDRPYDHLHLGGNRATPEQIALAAVAAVPHATLHYYELPPSADAAVRVIVGVGQHEFRVYVNPQSLAILRVGDEDKRPMVVLSHLHGELLAGDTGSRIVELAASWAIVLLVSGLYLWWPRQTEKLAGVLWVRLGKGKRIFWRDLHAVTGVWVTAFALFILLTGLPWAKGWGSYFKKVRQITGTATAHQDWTNGRSSELAERASHNHNVLGAQNEVSGMEHAAHMQHQVVTLTGPQAYAPFNVLVPTAASLHLADPVEIMPATRTGGTWTIKSDSQNRTLRDIIQADPKTGAVVSRQNFNQRLLFDRMVGVGVAAHEGQLFGVFNQILGLATAMGLVTLCISAVVLWWRRRNVGVLGAPVPQAKPSFSFVVAAVIIALAIYLPEMAASLALVLLLEKLFLSRVPSISRWLGLTPAGRIAVSG
jgi:uncharacterized iron-regulated membrane protein